MVSILQIHNRCYVVGKRVLQQVWPLPSGAIPLAPETQQRLYEADLQGRPSSKAYETTFLTAFYPLPLRPDNDDGSVDAPQPHTHIQGTG